MKLCELFIFFISSTLYIHYIKYDNKQVYNINDNNHIMIEEKIIIFFFHFFLFLILIIIV